MKLDLHVHTRYSDGEATIADVLEHADQRRLDAVAITDHALSYKGITPRQFKLQRAEVEALRASFRVKALVGLEVEMSPGGVSELEAFEHPDILLLSSHTLLPPRVHLNSVERALAEFQFQVLAHHRWHPLYPADPAVEEQLVELLRRHGVAVELNNRHHLPGDGFLRRCAEAGLGFTTASDAHRTVDVGRTDWSDAVARRLFALKKVYIPAAQGE